MRLSHARAAARLALWLGPWAGTRAPRAVTKTVVVLDPARAVRAYAFRPPPSIAPRGVYVIAPGLHYLGPDDPRMDRFCRVLAGAGFVVVAAFLPDFLALRIAPSATEDLALAFDHACAIADDERLPGPAVFSISFGSRPAIELCASERGRRASALLLFGGFCDFDATVRFAITGRAEHEGRAIVVPHDPLNAPVVHLNLLDAHDASLDKELLARAMRRMVEDTWGRNELKKGEARAPRAHAIARDLGDKERSFFLTACGLEGSGETLLEAGLARAGATFAWADPRPFLARMHPPVVIVHGRDDDVIPWPQAIALENALPRDHCREVIITGLYGHTGAALPGPAAIAREVRALGRVVHRFATAPEARASQFPRGT